MRVRVKKGGRRRRRTQQETKVMMMMMRNESRLIECSFSLFPVSRSHGRPASCRWFKPSGGVRGRIKGASVAEVRAAAPFISFTRGTATLRCDWLEVDALLYTGVHAGL